jgi:hypothetical protein
LADIELTLGGDASGATAALNQTGEATGNLASQTGKAVVAWQLMADVATKAASAVVKYGVDAVKAFAAAERIQAQLNRAAGEYGETLGKQAEALSRVYAVDDDIIKQSQTLLAQWGGVGAATKETTEAILNYAAATGTDAVGATQALIRNVESGGVGMAKLGIHFKETGKKGDDLAAAVGAINAKFGGAALTDANTLSGSAHAAQLAVDDLQKSIGGMLGTMLDQSGGLAFITEGIRKMTAGLEVAFAVANRARAIFGGVLRGDISVATAGDELKNTATAAFMRGGVAAPGALPGAANDLTNKGRKDAAKIELELHEETAAAHDNIYAHEEASAAHTFTKIEKMRFELAKTSEDAAQAEAKRAGEEAEKLARQESDAFMKSQKDMLDRTKKKEQDARAAGDAIGAAMVNALADQLSKLAEGGEFDAALFVGDIMAAAVGVAGGIIGTALGAPAVGAAIGNLAAMGVRAGASAISRSGKNKARASTYHDGGWVGAPRYHDGTWIAPDEQKAILQRDERVLSRREVANAGGPAAVDRMARGGGAGVTVNIQAIDSQSAADSFRTKLGDGLRQALRSGQGAMPALLGVGPR